MGKVKVALALSTGGARGIAFIGVIEELQRQGYEITSVSGCSMGALIGAAYAADKMEECKKVLCALNKKKLLSLSDFSFSKKGFLKGNRIMKVLASIIPDVNIEDLRIPFSAVATDIINGKEVLFNSGSLHEAIRASISLPFIFQPAKHKDILLTDGGLINPLPLDRVTRTDNDILVGVVASASDDNNRINIGMRKINLISMLMTASTLMIQNNIKTCIEKSNPDMIISIPGTKYSVMHFNKAKEIIEIGREAAKLSLP